MERGGGAAADADFSVPLRAPASPSLRSDRSIFLVGSSSVRSPPARSPVEGRRSDSTVSTLPHGSWTSSSPSGVVTGGVKAERPRLGLAPYCSCSIWDTGTCGATAGDAARPAPGTAVRPIPWTRGMVGRPVPPLPKVPARTAAPIRSSSRSASDSCLLRSWSRLARSVVLRAFFSSGVSPSTSE